MQRRILAALLMLSACAAAPPSAGTAAAVGEELSGIAVPGTTASITARLCRPAQPGAARLVVINHGSPANAAERPAMRPASCTTEVVRWFTDRGFAVMLPLRRGYGASGGVWAEAFGRCQEADFVSGGRATAADFAGAIAQGRRLPGILPDGVVVVGQSAGGWGSLALAASNPPGVAAIVNMAGGRGGWLQGAPNVNCRPDRLVEGAAGFGATARGPTLWVYTANDTFFGPDLARQMHAAFIGAGGQARLEALAPFGRDGHSLFFSQGGSAIWGPPVEAFLARQGGTTGNR